MAHTVCKINKFSMIRMSVDQLLSCYFVRGRKLGKKYALRMESVIGCQWQTGSSASLHVQLDVVLSSPHIRPSQKWSESDRM